MIKKQNGFSIGTVIEKLSFLINKEKDLPHNEIITVNKTKLGKLS